MKNSYFPDMFKEKFKIFINYLYALILFLVSLLTAMSLLTFNIDDNSFLTSTSNSSNNILGDPGSYFASFVFYTFGILGYLVIFFFFIYSILVLRGKTPKYIFIRLLFFFFSLVLLPQTVISLSFEFVFIDKCKILKN